MRRGALVFFAFAVAPVVARGESLSTAHTDQYYLAHGGAIAGGLVASLGVSLALGEHGPGYDLRRFSPDIAARSNFSMAASGVSDVLLGVTATTPLFAQASEGFTVEFGNASIVYGEAMVMNVLITNLTKHLVRRPRPYTHSTDPRVREFAESQGSDANASFFSGHASISATAATTGSVLYAMRTDDRLARHVMWGTELALAGFTAGLRVRAGRHYPTDVLVGTAVGVTLGFVVPAAHRLELSRLQPTELATGAGGLVVAYALAAILPFGSAGSPKVSLMPESFPAGGGVKLAGVF